MSAAPPSTGARRSLLAAESPHSHHCHRSSTEIIGAKRSAIKQHACLATARVSLLASFVRGRSSFSIVMRRKLSDQPRWDREQLARYGIGVEDAQRVVENAIGGANVSTVVNGQERYRVSGGPHPHLAQSWRPGRLDWGDGGARHHGPWGPLPDGEISRGGSWWCVALSRMVLAVKK